MAVFLRQCHFQIGHFSLKIHDWRTENFHCLAPPGKVKSALALKNEDSVNKEKHSLRNFVVLQSMQGKLLKQIPPDLNRDFWWKKQILKKTLSQKNGYIQYLESKCLHENFWSRCHSAGKRIFYALMHSPIWFSPWFLWN